MGVRRAAFAAAPLSLFVVFAALPSRDVRTERVSPITTKPRIIYHHPVTPPPLPVHSLYLSIEPGDTLETLFTAGGLRRDEAVGLATEFGAWADLKRLRPGDLVRFTRSADEVVQDVQLRLTGWGDVHASRDAGGTFAVQADRHPQRWIERVVTATVRSSLYEAVEAAGETPQLVPQLADIFQWDVDFFRLKEGDSFSFVVDRRYVGEDHLGYGPIRAAKFVFQGETYEAFRFEWPDGTAGYYTRVGTPVRKQFLKAPLRFTRITSGFTHRRYHPILRRFRPHYGIDYGAPVGTPVLATADGTVSFAGYDRGEGNCIRIRHNSRMETAYLHLSRFSKGVRKGAKVNQGQVIGYVGMTGLTTGPHLDYRVSENGKPLNPLQLKSITPDPLHGAALRRFKDSVAEALPKLHTPAPQVASTEKLAARHSSSSMK